MTYDKYADNYDQRYQSVVSRVENCIIRGKLLEHGIDKKDTVLDFGCGTGFLLDLIDFKGVSYFGVDVSDKMIAIARDKHPSKSFVKMAASNVYHGSADAVVSLFSIPYIGLEGVSSAYRNLKPDGIFFCVYYEKPYKSPDSVYYKRPLKYKLCVAPKVKKVIAECDRFFERIDSIPICQGYRLAVYRRNEK